MLTTVFAGGSAPARGRIGVRRDDYEVRRLVGAALLLLVAGAAGAYYKAHVLGGVPLLSGNADQLRARAFNSGGSAIPSWASALTNCFYLSMWTALVALWVLPEGSRRWRAPGLVALAGLGLFGATLEASRNITLFALAVPVIALYLIARPRRRRARVAQLGAALAIVLVVVAGAFVARLTQTGSAGHDFLSAETKRQPVALRPLFPIYINGVFPLEAARRVYGAFPRDHPYGLGGYSLLSLPDAFFPRGKLAYGETVGELMANRSGKPGEGGLAWTVASYQGRAYADLGAVGVVLVSVLLGLGFGRLRRWARVRDGLLPVALVAYVAYYAAFMAYDNLLSFTLIGAFDLVVILALERYVRGRDLRVRRRRPTRRAPRPGRGLSSPTS